MSVSYKKLWKLLIDKEKLKVLIVEMKAEIAEAKWLMAEGAPPPQAPEKDKKGRRK